MSTIQNLKNFIRHGKQARAAEPPRDQPTTNISPVHAHQQQQRHHAQAVSDPNFARQNQHYQPPQPLPGEYSAGAVDHRNVAAQAGNAAANAAGHGQKIQHQGREAELQQIVNEEREQKGKLPRYPGLERYILQEKMGDGAFSNVYRAKDTQQPGEVAIKVVRKFEMNANQVRPASRTRLFLLSPPPSLSLSLSLSLFLSPLTLLPSLVKRTSPTSD
jgi:serine/threonine-protein kinase RCK2